ncbi:FMN-binding protein [Gemmatimonadota bacterium]
MTDENLNIDTANESPPAVQQQDEVPPWRLVLTLAVAGALAGFLIVFVYVATLPAITAYKAEVLRLAVYEVLGSPHQVDTLYVVDGALTDELAEGQTGDDYEQIYPGYREDGTQIGYAIASAEFGFQDVVRVIFGYDADTQSILGMLVLEHKETPGLGDKIVKDMQFVGQFGGAGTPLLGVKIGQGTGDDHEIDMITGATISSRAVIRIINNALERIGPLIEAYDGGGSS